MTSMLIGAWLPIILSLLYPETWDFNLTLGFGAGATWATAIIKLRKDK